MLVFITGATSGIGKSTARLFAGNGNDLIVTGRREERLKELKDQLESEFKVKVTTLNFDVRSSEQCEKAISGLTLTRPIDVLVNNAGLAAGLSSIQDGELSDWERMIDTNIRTTLYF